MKELHERADDLYLTLNVYLAQPKTLSSMDACLRSDRSAAEYLQRLERLTDDLREYRRMVAMRAMDVSTAVYTFRLSLIRRREWYYSKSDRIFYDVKLEKVFDDPSIKPQPVIAETFPGTERHKAKARFEALKKERPGVHCHIDIGKGRWER